MKEVQLTQGYVALVDDEDYQRVTDSGPWHAVVYKRGTYAMRNVKVNDIWFVELLHRFILGISDPNTQVDHRNRKGLDCQSHNLRKATPAQNSHNQKKRSGTSHYKGVWRVGNKWRAGIKVAYKQVCLGRYSEEKDAAKAYDEAALKYFGEFACTNTSLGLY